MRLGAGGFASRGRGAAGLTCAGLLWPHGEAKRRQLLRTAEPGRSAQEPAGHERVRTSLRVRRLGVRVPPSAPHLRRPEPPSTVRRDECVGCGGADLTACISGKSQPWNCRSSTLHTDGGASGTGLKGRAFFLLSGPELRSGPGIYRPGRRGRGPVRTRVRHLVRSPLLYFTAVPVPIPGLTISNYVSELWS